MEQNLFIWLLLKESAPLLITRERKNLKANRAYPRIYGSLFE
jgi:hypothetical protein